MPQVDFVTFFPITFWFFFVFFVGFIIFGTELLFINILDHKQRYLLPEFVSIFFSFTSKKIEYRLYNEEVCSILILSY